MTQSRFTVLWRNLNAKSGRFALDKDSGHSLRALLCLSRPDFTQIPCSTDVLGLKNWGNLWWGQIAFHDISWPLYCGISYWMNYFKHDFLFYPAGDSFTLHGFVNKSEREIRQVRSRQGLRPFPSSASLSITPRFYTNSVFNWCFRLKKLRQFVMGANCISWHQLTALLRYKLLNELF